jgi:hypothetical protein
VWTAARSGRPPADVLARLEALPPASSAGIRPWRPFWLALLAEACLAAGRPDRASALVTEAFAEVDALGGSFSVAVLTRLREELGGRPD